MAKKYVENTGSSPIWVDGRMIPPGEGREVDVPDEAAAPVEAPVPDANAALQELLAGNVDAVKAGIAGLSGETLQQLLALERDGKARKGVVEALGDAIIAAADAKLGGSDVDQH